MTTPYLEFVSALVAEGREAILEAAAHGIDSVHLRDVEAQLAYSNIRSFVAKYDGRPTPQTVEGETGVVLPPPPLQSAAYWIDKIQELRLFFRLQDAHGEIGDLITAEKPNDALEKMESSLRDFRSDGLAAARVTPMFSLLPDVYSNYLEVKGGKRGIPWPWPTLDDDTMGMHPEDLILITARTGVGKCIHADSEIVDPITGIPHTIEALYRGGSSYLRVPTWSAFGGIHAAQVTAAHDTGRKECLRFVLGTGRSIVVTPEHPFLTPDGWRRADAIGVGGTIGIPARMPAPEIPQPLSPSTVDILAVLLADGSLTCNSTGFSNGDPTIVSRMQDAARDFDCVVKPLGGDDYAFVGTQGKTNGVLDLARAHGVPDGKGTVEKTLPEALWRLPVPHLERFLSLFWMCGGSVDETGPNIVLGSEKMLRQIQSLLLRLGIQSGLRYEPVTYHGEVRDLWGLRVYASSWEAFSGSVVLWGDKGRALGKLYARPLNTDVGSPVVSRHERDAWQWDSDLFWDTVEHVEDVGEQKIYDLTVEPTSCFVANDVLVHNTWIMASIALHAFRSGHKVLFATTELSQRTIATRFFSLYFSIPYDMIRKGRMTIFDEAKFADAAANLSGSNGIDVIGGDFDFRVESLEAAIADASPAVVLLDGAYLLKMDGDNRVEKAANAFNELKRIAKRQNVPIVITWQLNRAATKSKAKGGSGYAIESISLSDVGAWNSDLILAAWQDQDMIDNKHMGLKHLKGREGVGRDFSFNWNFDYMDFSEVDGGGDAADPDDEDDPVF